MARTPEQNNAIITGSIPRQLLLFFFPIWLGTMFQQLYNTVDTLIVGNFVGTQALAAVGATSSFVQLLVGLFVGLCSGAGVIIAQSFGAGDHDEVNRQVHTALALAIAGGAALTVIGLLISRPVLRLMQTPDEIVGMASEYLQIYFLGMIPQMIYNMGTNILRAVGDSKRPLYFLIVASIVNIVLDIVLVAVIPLGVAGAAIATVIGQWVSGIMVIIFNVKFNPEVQLHKKYLPLDGKTVAAILTVGIPSIVMNGIGSVMNFGINQILQGFAETATGVFGVYFKLQSFFFMPLFGLNNATISIIAYNYGARKPQRITKTLKISCTAALCLMTVGLLVFQFFPDLLLGMFNPSQAFLEIGRVALRTISWSFPIAAICIALGASFQALGNGIYSTIVSLCRQLVVLLPVAYLLSLTGEVQRVWLAFPIAEIVSGTVTFICFTRIYRQKIKPLFEQA